MPSTGSWLINACALVAWRCGCLVGEPACCREAVLSAKSGVERLRQGFPVHWIAVDIIYIVLYLNSIDFPAKQQDSRSRSMSGVPAGNGEMKRQAKRLPVWHY